MEALKQLDGEAANSPNYGKFIPRPPHGSAEWPRLTELQADSFQPLGLWHPPPAESPMIIVIALCNDGGLEPPTCDFLKGWLGRLTRQCGLTSRSIARFNERSASQ
jgi:hypothetical protein